MVISNEEIKKLLRTKKNGELLNFVNDNLHNIVLIVVDHHVENR